MSTLFWVSFGALWAIVVLQAGVLLEVVRRLAAEPATAPAPTTADALAPGALAPDFTAHLVENGKRFDSVSLRGRRVLLAFVSPGCQACEDTFALTQETAARLDARLVVVCGGERPACRDLLTRHVPNEASLWDADGSIAKRFGVAGTPLAVVLDEQGRVVKYGRPEIARDVPPPLHAVPTTLHAAEDAESHVSEGQRR